MAKQRNYKAEYERRIARGTAAGFSRSQARGHARVEKGETPVSVVKRLGKFIAEISVSKHKRIKHRSYTVSYDRRAEMIDRMNTLKGKASRVFFTISDGEKKTTTDVITLRQGNEAIKRMSHAFIKEALLRAKVTSKPTNEATMILTMTFAS